MQSTLRKEMVAETVQFTDELIRFLQGRRMVTSIAAMLDVIRIACTGSYLNIDEKSVVIAMLKGTLAELEDKEKQH